MVAKKQCTEAILMIRPKHFGFNELTAQSNFFQHKNDFENINSVVQKEFDTTVELLRANGIDIFVFEDRTEVITPDSIFPNNWITFLHNGDVCIFPMQATNRRIEKRMDIIDALKKNFKINSTNDYSYYEQSEKFLEGTGSIVFDHVNALAYATESVRTDVDLLKSFCKTYQYDPIIFHATDINHKPVYHTNVLMCVGESFCIFCSDSVVNPTERKLVMDKLNETGKEVLEISTEQMQNFAGNMLQLKNKSGKDFIVCSQAAFDSLTKHQKERLTQYGMLLPCPVNTIETIGGGSIRCMITEIFSKRID